MKILSIKNLKNILDKWDPDEYISLDDIEVIFKKYGGDRYIEDGRWEITNDEIRID